MKKTTPLFFACATLLAACSHQPTSMQRVQTGEPIMPIHATTDTTRIFLTDYLPSLEEADVQDCRFSGEHYTLLCHEAGQLAFVGKTSSVEVLTVSDGKTAADIAILPQQAYRQALTTVSATDDAITMSIEGETLEEMPNFVCFVQNKKLNEVVVANDDHTYSLDLKNALKEVTDYQGRTYLRVYATTDSVLYNDLLIPLQDGKPVRDAALLNRHDANAQILYSLMIDRFYNAKTENDAPLNQEDVLPRVDYQGGDIKGITEKIEAGFFDDLGITTIWVSPISQNPTTAWGLNQEPRTRFSGYHGYWPIYNNKVDDRFGTSDELHEMLATAHAHNINVILDYVANHVHIESPTLQEHPDWITDSILPDGRRNFELWDECRLTTWFDVHIPSLDLERPEVCEAMTDTALFWVANYDFDGYRHDACKHIPLDYWRLFTHKMKSRFPDRQFWMVGETYGDAELISSYVKTGMLNAQFDFNIYHTVIDVLGKPNQSMQRIADVVDESCRTYGSHHTMANISGNHDKCRFISLVGGAVAWDENDKLAGWTRDIRVTANDDSALEARAFKKALLLEVINLTIPGVPCIYQGDEYGQCGANDPDNRRMMRFDGLNENEANFREQMLQLTHLRRTSMPLIYGDYRRLYCDDDVLVFSRSYMGEKVVVAINNSDEAKHLSINDLELDIEACGYVIR